VAAAPEIPEASDHDDVSVDGEGSRVPRAMTKVTLVAALVAGAAVAAGFVACTGGGRGLGEFCDTSADCAGTLQCFSRLCMPRCLHHVDCGDGYRCDDGECQVVDGGKDTPCESELECGPGFTCRLQTTISTPPGTCQAHHPGAVPGASCAVDSDCRGGACALGHCLELCAEEPECQRGWTCAAIPRLTDDALGVIGNFDACLPESGAIAFDLPLDPTDRDPTIKIPVPSTAVAAEVVLEVGDPFQRIGATLLTSPINELLYTLPLDRETFLSNKVRHEPLPGISVLKLPGSPAPEDALKAGAYTMTLGVFRDDGGTPSDARRVRVVEKLGLGAALDLHFYFADLADHPCLAQLGELNAATAPTSRDFQDAYLAEVRAILAPALGTGATTYEDLVGHPGLDGLDSRGAGELLALDHHAHGVAVFFVRSIAPAGLQIVVGGTPGAPLPGTRASGVAISVDSLCYRDWRVLARQSAHAIARHLGLFRNVDPDGGQDPIADSLATEDNLMHFTELGGTTLSPGQRQMLRLSPEVQ